MKSGTLYLALGLAPAAMCAPVPMIWPEGREPTIDAYQTSTTHRLRSKHQLHKLIPVSTGNSASANPFDNRPITPSTSAEPSQVLALPRPVATSYLLSLVSGEKVHHNSATHPTSDLIDSFSVTEMEISVAIPSPAPQGAPCQHARFSREHNDMLVVMLALVFLMVVVTMEMWVSICRSARRIFGRQGAIRLEDETTCRSISVQASPEICETANEEKSNHETPFLDTPASR